MQSVFIIITLLVWLTILSYLYWKQYSLLQKVFPKISDGQSLLTSFKDVLNNLELAHKEGQLLSKNIKALTLDGLSHIQKIALTRYNPYNDTGGNQSFTYVLLDAKDCGILITSLHTRSGTRIYAKHIKNGQSELELSDEETQTLAQALKHKE